MIRVLKMGFLLVLVSLFSACATTPEPAPVGETTTQPVYVAPEPPQAETTPAPVQVISPLRDPDSMLSQRLVFFAFDSFSIEPQFRELIEAHARYLITHPSATMMLRGHTDERGTHEYNIALGQRRADAVKRMMVLLGVGEPKIETVSFGKEMPRNAGHDEAAWAENRRVEIVYVTE